MSKKIAVAYIPVLHKGYLDFLRTCEDREVDALYLVGDELLMTCEELDYINRKDRLRALPLKELLDSVRAVCAIPVYELTHDALAQLADRDIEILTPREDVGRVIVEKFFKAHRISFLDIFLRWNKDNADAYAEPEAESMQASEFQKKICSLMREESEKSFDWWRQVGAALIKGEEIVCVAHNEHMPEAQTPNIDGDVRSIFKKGININYGTAAHAEVVALGGAAKAGIKTDGAELYLTDFPCPYCARLIASSGVKTVYFKKGYAVLEGDAFLKQAGVKVVHLRE
jgi:dCMP deaminase